MPTSSYSAIRRASILIADDHPLVSQGLRALLRPSYVVVGVVNDGREVHEAVERTKPDLILLDLIMPKLQGFEVLKALKQEAATAGIPVVVLTTSRADQDILRSYALHANCYITKPVDLDQFITVVKSIEEFWFTIVTLPHPRTRGGER